MSKQLSFETVSNNKIQREIIEQIKTCRPARLYISKQKKKGNTTNIFALRAVYARLPAKKQIKYLKKSVTKYIELLDEKDINDDVQIQSKLFEILLTKKEQKLYFESLSAPTKPAYSVPHYYAEVKKQENDDNPKPWKSLLSEEKKAYVGMLKNAKSEYSIQVKNFAECLPNRLKLEYLSFINQKNHGSNPDLTSDENNDSVSISQRRKSVQSTVDNDQSVENDFHRKLSRSELDDLHKCKPPVVYYEHKVPDDEKPTFPNSLSKNAYIRSLFSQLSEKKRRKFILKSTQKWSEFLEAHPSIIKDQIPTLRLLLGKMDDIHYYFSSLGLPIRPPSTALYLFNQERQETDSQQNWADLSQATKDEYIKRLSKLKHDYHENLIKFFEKTLPSDYLRLEFFRNVKYAAKDYKSAIKDCGLENKDGQLKITQYLVRRSQTETDPVKEFQRIKKELLATNLTNEQRKLVEKLGLIMNRYFDETITTKTNTSKSTISTEIVNSNKSANINASPSKSQSMISDDVIELNGEATSDNIEHQEETIPKKKKKKHKRSRSEAEEMNASDVDEGYEKQWFSSPPTKKRK